MKNLFLLLILITIIFLISSCQQSKNANVVPTVTVTVTADSKPLENQPDEDQTIRINGDKWQNFINVNRFNYRITDDSCAGIYKNSLFIDFISTNISGKDIVFLEGEFYIYDLEGRELFAGVLRYDKEFQKGETIRVGNSDDDCYGLSENNYLHKLLLNIFVPSTQTTSDYTIKTLVFDNGQSKNFSVS